MPDDADRAGVVVEAWMAGVLDGLRLRPLPDRAPDGANGRCRDCRGDIAPERLACLPGALRCVECQDDIERARHGVAWTGSGAGLG